MIQRGEPNTPGFINLLLGIGLSVVEARQPKQLDLQLVHERLEREGLTALKTPT